MKLLLLLALATVVRGHGNMVKPLAIWDEQQYGWCWDEDGNHEVGCGNLDLPHTEFEDVKGKKPDCFQYWFSDWGSSFGLEGEPTIPEEMRQPEVSCVHQAGASGDHGDGPNYMRYPWYFAGTAPASPCGTMGGRPNGCDYDGQGEFGECCSGNCDSYAMGDNAENYVWPDMPVTEWKLGSYQEVAWYCGANHAGGYSYRICKMPEGGISEVTEECFQQTPLEFVGDEQWVEYAKDRQTGIRTELPALQTNVGTFPAGSMWRANPFYPPTEEDPAGNNDYGRGHVIDNIKVPANLEPGEYVISHRWDTKCTPQVWSSCAVVKLVQNPGDRP